MAGNPLFGRFTEKELVGFLSSDNLQLVESVVFVELYAWSSLLSIVFFLRLVVVIDTSMIKQY